jgi:hypothetical protein
MRISCEDGTGRRLCESWRARMSSSREVEESKQPQLFANLHPATSLHISTSKGDAVATSRVDHRDGSQEWRLLCNCANRTTTQLLDSILKIGTLTEQPRRSSRKPDRDCLFNDALKDLIQASSGPLSDQINVSSHRLT